MKLHRIQLPERDSLDPGKAFARIEEMKIKLKHKRFEVNRSLSEEDEIEKGMQGESETASNLSRPPPEPA